MRLGSLFSGYGGLDMAVQAVLNAHLMWYSEIEPAACRVLAAHHPKVSNLGDVKQIDWNLAPTVDVLTGGYPCQPFSNAGMRKGKDDERHLWPYVRDAISALGPKLVILENVAGHLSLGFADVLADLAELGMSARWGIVRASDAGACHVRKRLFIIAHSEGCRWGAWSRFAETTTRHSQEGTGDSGQLLANATARRWQQCAPEPAAAKNSSPTTDAADSDSERHGSEQITRGLGQMGSAAKGSRWALGTAWQKPGAGSTQDAADSDSTSSQTWQHTRQDRQRVRQQLMGSADVAWGRYEPAIRRWEHVLGRTAPRPTYKGATGKERLAPMFVEWMMGLPEGHVTGHSLSAAQELKMLGNGVVPQQACLALALLMNLQPMGQHT